MNKDIYASVSTMIIMDGYTLGEAKMDKDGYFCDVPAIVLGKVTRNATAYDAVATAEQIKGPDTSIHKRITEGVLFGEYGHPYVNVQTKEGLQRLLHLEPTRKSGHIRKMEVRHVDDLDLDIIFMDIKASGPYGKHFAESMLDPTQNTAFSLRGLSSVKTDRRTGVAYKKLNPLVTIDMGMAGGGFKEAAKRYMPSVESLDIHGQDTHTPIDIEEGYFQQIAMESFTDTELNDIFKSKNITIGTQVSGYVTKHDTIVTPDQLPSGLMHSILKSKRK